MNVEDTVYEGIRYFPTLFGKKADVLAHIFCTLGGGYNWVDGELCEDLEMPSLEGRHEKPRQIDENNVLARCADRTPFDHCYPMSKNYCNLASVPLDVKDDWFEAALWVADMVINMKNPDSYAYKSMGYKHEDNVKIARQVKKNLLRRKR